MAGILSSAPHPSFSLLPPYLHLSFRRNPRLSHFPSLSSKKIRKIRIDLSSSGENKEPGPSLPAFTDEWGEQSEPEAEPPAEADLPRNEDEWGKDEGTKEAALITDEWGEKAELEAEEPGRADAAAEGEDDEWGNGSAAAAEDGVGDLKRCLVDTLYGTELGFRASGEVRGEIFELVSQLEAKNPTPAPNEAPGLLDGNWILL